MNNLSEFSAQKQLDLQRAARVDTMVRMFEDVVPATNEESVYLTPTFSDTRNVHNHPWHVECCHSLRKLGYQGLILIPQNRVSYGGGNQRQSLEWCTEALTQASHLIFSINKNQAGQEVRQLIHQIGVALGRLSTGGTQTILISVPHRRLPCPMTKYSLMTAKIPIYSNLHELLHDSFGQ